MSVVADYPDWSPHVAHADQIAATGVPLLTKSTRLYQQAFINVGPGATASTGQLSVSQIGYEVVINTQAGTPSTSPFCRVSLTWTDSTTGATVATDTYIVPMAASPGLFPVVGRGPTKADELTLTVKNLDTVTAPSVSVIVLQNSRVYPADRWSWANPAMGSVTVPGFTKAVLPNDQSVLGIFSDLNVPASSSVPILCGMAPGQMVNLAGNTAGVSPGSITINVTTKPDSEYTPNGIVLRASLTTAAFQFQFIAPAAPLEAIWNNNATSGTLIVTGMMTAQSP